MIVLAGRTASGKDSCLKELMKLGMKSVISYTTRDMRPGEMQDVEYHFISDEEFEVKKNSGFFAETTEYNTVNRIKKYGSAIEDLTDTKAIILNPEGVREIRKIDSINPIVFYIVADDSTIKGRLRFRGDDVAESERRMRADNHDFKNFEDEADYVFHSDNDNPPSELAKLILETYLKKKEGIYE